MPSRSDILVRIDSQFQGAGFKSAESSAKVFEQALARQESTERRLAALQMAAAREDESRTARRMASYEALGRGVTAFGLASAVGLAMAAKAATDWESAWAGVTKTVGGSATQMGALEDQLRSLANELPVTHDEIAAIAEAAGALGVKRSDIASFTQTIVELSTASKSLDSETAADGLAKLGNVMGVIPAEAHRAGSALIALGNDGASTEADILALSLRIGGAGRTIGLTEAQVMGFASALSSVGIEAEAGGSAISQVMVDMAKSVETGGEKLEKIAALAGMTGSEFRRAFEDDAATAITTVVAGLGDMQATGGDVFGTLDDLGWGAIRVRDTLLRSAGASDLMTRSLELGSQAWADNTALTDAASKRFETAESRIATARNELTNMAIDLGGVVLPAIAGAADRVGSLATAFTELPDPVKSSVVVLGGLVTVATLAGGAALMAVPKFAALNRELALMGPRGKAASRAMTGAAGILTGPWGLAITAATIGLGAWANAQYEAQEAAKAFAATLDKQTAAFTASSRQSIIEQLQKDFSPEDWQAIDGALSRARIGMSDYIAATEAGGPVLDDFRARFDAWQESAMASGDDDLASKAQALGNAYAAAGRNIQGGTDIARQAIEVSKKLGDTEQETAGKATQAASAAAGLSGNLDDQKSSADDAANAIAALSQKVKELGSVTVDADTAAINYQGAIDAATQSVKDNGKTLDINTEKGRANKTALIELAEKVKANAAAQFEMTGKVKDATGATEVGRKAFIAAAVQMGLSGTAAGKLADKYGLIPDDVATTVTANTAAASAAVDTYLRRLNDIPLSRTVMIRTKYSEILDARGAGNAYGGIVNAYAQGGYRPGIFADGADIVRFAEKGTGGEAYIPFAPDRRDRAVSVWQEAGRRLGMDQGGSGGPVTITGTLESPWGPVQVSGQIDQALGELAAGLSRSSRQRFGVRA